MKIVRNTKVVKLPSATGSVEATFRRAMKKAKEQGWKRVVIIGEGDEIGHNFNSCIGQDTVVGMIERMKHAILHN